MGFLIITVLPERSVISLPLFALQADTNSNITNPPINIFVIRNLFTSLIDFNILFHFNQPYPPQAAEINFKSPHAKSA
jgi:hypothetical protein